MKPQILAAHFSLTWVITVRSFHAQHPVLCLYSGHHLTLFVKNVPSFFCLLHSIVSYHASFNFKLSARGLGCDHWWQLHDRLQVRKDGIYVRNSGESFFTSNLTVSSMAISPLVCPFWSIIHWREPFFIFFLLLLCSLTYFSCLEETVLWFL